MLKKFLDYIHSNNLCAENDTLLVAVSGGVDSVVLAHLLAQAQYSMVIAHCNFNLRGIESDKDEQFVKSLASGLGAECVTVSFETKKYARENGVSIEMAARELRYKWFYKLLGEKHLKHLVTGHHLNDSIETTLYNLAKGTGISGVRGIKNNNGNIIRPLLWATKAELVQYAEENDLTWREDASNAEDDYMRNKIRNNIIPELKKINPSLESTFINTQKRLQEMEDILHELVDKYKADHYRQEGVDHYFEIAPLQKANKTVLVEELFKPFGFNYEQAIQIHEAILSANPGKIFLSDGYQLNVDREAIIVSPSRQDGVDFYIEENDDNVYEAVWKFSCFISDDVEQIFKSRNKISVDYDKLKFPLKMRKWQQGDVFQPLGMRGKKKLSDFMIDEKIPLNLKNRVYVLTSDDEIVWVVGYRVDDRFKITPATRRIYNIVTESHD